MSVYAIIRDTYYDVLRVESIAYKKPMMLKGPGRILERDSPGYTVYRTKRRAKSVLRKSGVNPELYGIYEIDAEFDRHVTPIDNSPTDGKLRTDRKIIGEV